MSEARPASPERPDLPSTLPQRDASSTRSFPRAKSERSASASPHRFMTSRSTTRHASCPPRGRRRHDLHQRLLKASLGAVWKLDRILLGRKKRTQVLKPRGVLSRHEAVVRDDVQCCS